MEGKIRLQTFGLLRQDRDGTSEPGKLQNAMFVYRFRTKNNIPWKGITIDNVKNSGENFAKAFAFPAEDECAHRYELLAVETSTDGFVMDGHFVGYVELMDGLECDEIVDFASGVEPHLVLNVIIYV